MRRNVQILLLLLSGAGLLHIALLSDVYLRYVKEGLRPPLIVSGVLLVALGMVGAARDGFPFARPTTFAKPTAEPAVRAAAGPARADHGQERGHGREGGHGHEGSHGHDGGQAREDSHGHDGGQAHEDSHGHDGGQARESRHEHGHDHSRGPKVAWLLFFPAISLLFFTPPALGSYTAARDGDTATASRGSSFARLPDTSPLVMPLSDFSSRARRDGSRSLDGRTVAMTGFVTPGQGGGWYLTRLSLSCCAADSQAVKVRVFGAPPPPADSWVTVTGTWHPVGAIGTPSATAALDADGVRHAARPANPYADAPPPRA
ncbi:TIGR03943 family protein [Streptomyces sp. NPDC051776]|uniref:TIGR03943 family putative permease subunit n=1 Tax=Streptomyces sp. NPDC051776 TaxID=3155414 RepID=UPI00343BDE79